MMPITTIHESTDTAHLAAPIPTAHSCAVGISALLVDAIRLIRTLRAEYRACSELLSLSIEMLHERDVELDRVRQRYHALLDERRSLAVTASEPQRRTAA
jgi:hypothetical protein